MSKDHPTPEATKRRDEISAALVGLHLHKGTLLEQLDALGREIRELENEREYIDVYGVEQP